MPLRIAGLPVGRSGEPEWTGITGGMAEVAGITGRPDALNRYFGDDFVNRPPMGMTRAFEKMQGSINGATVSDGFEVLAGVNRC
jgi:hypothetical protein